MPTLPNMGLVTPTPGGSSGTWDDQLNTALGVLDAHTHASGSGVRITPAAININADLTMAGFGLTNLDRAAFAAIVALTTGSRVLFVSSSDNELYWRTNAGTNVKLTNGTALNVAAFVGGIGGDYTAVSAALNYDDSNARYTHRAAGGSNWARNASGEVRIYETGTTDTVYIGHAAPSALAASYTVTWPLALPGAKTLVQCSSAGVLTFENTGIESVTMATNANITLSGTGEVKHGDKTLNFNGAAGQATNANFTRSSGVAGSVLESTGATTFLFAIPLLQGDRIKSVVFGRYGDGAVDISNTRVEHITSSGTVTDIGNTSVTNAAAAWADTTINVTDTTLAAGDALHLLITVSATGLAIGNVRVTYDRP